MNDVLKSFEEGFLVNYSIKELNGTDSHSWNFGPFYNKNVLEAAAYLLYKILLVRDNAFKIIKSKKKDLAFEFKITISNLSKVESSFVMKPGVSKEKSNDYLYYYYYVATRLYRELGITAPLKTPNWFIRVYEGINTSSKAIITNPTKEEKHLSKSRIEAIGRQFDPKIFEQIKKRSIVARK